jgi:hypothetical protein
MPYLTRLLHELGGEDLSHLKCRECVDRHFLEASDARNQSRPKQTHTHTHSLGSLQLAPLSLIEGIYINVKHSASGAVLAVRGVYSSQLFTHTLVCVPRLAAHDEIWVHLPHRYHLLLPTTLPSNLGGEPVALALVRGQVVAYDLRHHLATVMSDSSPACASSMINSKGKRAYEVSKKGNDVKSASKNKGRKRMGEWSW